MNDVLNFKSITTYRVALPLKFEFKTAKGTVRVRESIIIRIEDQQGYVGYGECVAFTDPFYTAETVDSASWVSPWNLPFQTASSLVTCPWIN